MTPEQELSEAAIRIRLAVQKAPRKQKLAVLKKELRQVPRGLRDAVDMLVTEGVEAVKSVHDRSSEMRRDRAATAVFGVLGLIAMVTIALKVPKPEPFQEKVFVFVLAVIFAACGAFLPGAVSVAGGYRPAVWVRATGALGLAVFVILIYKFLL